MKIGGKLGDATLPQDRYTPLEKFKRKDLSSWQGLHPDTIPSDAETAWQSKLAGNARGFLGNPVRALSFSTARLDGFTFPVQVWIEDARIVKIRAELPDLPMTPADYRDRFSTHPLVKDFNWDGIQVRSGEWAFHGLGITLFCNPEKDRVVILDVYKPATTQEYISVYTSTNEYREFPES